MMKLLKTPIGQGGFVYILTAYWNSKIIVKIGIAKDVEQRLQQLSKGCCSTKLGKMEEYIRIEVKLRHRVEALVHKELQGFKSEVEWCDSDHREFFNVPPEVALESIDRWKHFVDYGAYTSGGTVDNFWAERVDRLPRPSREELDAFQTDETKHHRLRHERYQQWLQRSIDMLDGSQEYN
jgi:hypothetical protein